MSSPAAGVRQQLHRWLDVVLLLVLALAVSPASAQETPPAPPSEPLPPPNDTPIARGYPVAGAAPSPLNIAATGAALKRWDILLRAGETWESNPFFRPGDTETTFAGLAGAEGSFSRFTPRSRFGARAGGDITRYHSLERTYTGGNAGLDFSRRLSSKVRLALADTAESRWARDSALLVNSGLYYGTQRVFTNRANLQLGYQATPRTTLTIDARHEYVSFDTPAQADGRQAAATVMLGRQITPRQTIGANYGYATSWSRGLRFDHHTAFGSWAGGLGQRWAAALAAGAIRSLSSGQWYPYASAQLTGDFRTTKLYAQVSHGLSMAYGFGLERESTIGSVGLAQRFGRRVLVSAAAGIDRSTALGGPVLTTRGANIGGNARFTLSRHFFLSALGSYWRRETDAIPAIPDTLASRVGLLLLYERTPS